ncbi:hypothetical protein IE989_32745 [Klebsiella pneumoniae]|nr:hypothetical protein [Klebsiella pneumoniae]
MLAVDELPPEFEEAELLPIGHIQRTTEVLLYFFRWRFRFAAAFLPFFRLSRFFLVLNGSTSSLSPVARFTEPVDTALLAGLSSPLDIARIIDGI